MGGPGSGGHNRKTDAQRKAEGRRPHRVGANVLPFKSPRRKAPSSLSEAELSAWRAIIGNIPAGVHVDPLLLESHARLAIRLRELNARPSLSTAESRFLIQLTESSRKISIAIRVAVEHSLERSKAVGQPKSHMSILLEHLDSPRYRRDLESARQARQAGWSGNVDDLNAFIEETGFKPDFRGLPNK